MEDIISDWIESKFLLDIFDYIYLFIRIYSVSNTILDFIFGVNEDIFNINHRNTFLLYSIEYKCESKKKTVGNLQKSSLDF